jgi:three-Cys-motif partner protein
MNQVHGNAMGADAQEPFEFDEIGYWSEIKHEILSRYAVKYTKILKAQGRFTISYIEGFSGAGIYQSKTSGDVVPGSPVYALSVDPPFDHYHFVELNPGKLSVLRGLIGGLDLDKNAEFYEGDCNDVLLKEIFPKIRYGRYERALCVLDPYGLHLDWEVVRAAGQSQSIEIFLNFPTMDMNRNALWKDPERTPASGIERMTRYWGDSSWRDEAYETKRDLFREYEAKLSTDVIVAAYRRRLLDIAGFRYVAAPLPMRNNQGAIVYYLFFASPNRTGEKIVDYIFNKFRNVGAG